MTTLNYTIKYDGDKPHTIKFTPFFVDRKGNYNARLGDIALSQFSIDGWHWERKELSHGIDLVRDKYINPEPMVADAQNQVTNLMDKLSEWDKFRKVFEEYDKSRNKEGV